eukprot:5564489-Pleurochrysis_carterae.AAC.1
MAYLSPTNFNKASLTSGVPVMSIPEGLGTVDTPSMPSLSLIRDPYPCPLPPGSLRERSYPFGH